MFFVRFLVLLFLAFYGWRLGQLPPDELNGFGQFIAFSFFVVAPALYLLPTYEAWKNVHPNFTAIALVNIFLGWSLLGSGHRLGV
jgi:Superinfection immunity protein